MPKFSKRLTLRLPANHPIFTYPEGARAEIARSWINNWLNIGSEIKSIQSKLENFTPVEKPAKQPEEPSNISTSQIDKKKFLKNIEDIL